MLNHFVLGVKATFVCASPRFFTSRSVRNGLIHIMCVSLRYTCQVVMGERHFSIMSAGSRQEAREQAVKATMVLLLGEEERQMREEERQMREEERQMREEERQSAQVHTHTRARARARALTHSLSLTHTYSCTHTHLHTRTHSLTHLQVISDVHSRTNCNKALHNIKIGKFCQ